MASDPWDAAEWRASFEGWIIEELQRAGLTVVGPIEPVHVRHWSIVLRAPVTGRDVYAKASATPWEAGLTEALGRWHPELFLPALAVDRSRGWMLLPDGGGRLRDLMVAPDDLWRWEAILTELADAQVALIPRRDELLALGVPDRGAARLPGLFADLLDDDDAIRTGRPDGVTAAELVRLRDLRPAVADLAGRLTALGIPDSFHEADLHDGNVFANDDRSRLFDHGDASIGHPFFSVVAALRNLGDRFDLTWEDDRLVGLRDRYLARWQGFGSDDELVGAFRLANVLNLIVGALAWVPFTTRYPDEFPFHVSTWLQELLEVMPYGSG